MLCPSVTGSSSGLYKQPLCKLGKKGTMHVLGNGCFSMGEAARTACDKVAGAAVCVKAHSSAGVCGNVCCTCARWAFGLPFLCRFGSDLCAANIHPFSYVCFPPAAEQDHKGRLGSSLLSPCTICRCLFVVCQRERTLLRLFVLLRLLKPEHAGLSWVVSPACCFLCCVDCYIIVVRCCPTGVLSGRVNAAFL